MVRDNASNMRVAVEKLGWEDVPCFAHTLQLAVSNGFEVSRLSAAGHKLVGHFKHSDFAMTAFNEKQCQMNVP